MALAARSFTVTDETGNVVASASIEVRTETPGQPLAVLYADRDGTVLLGNPFLADTDGFAEFYAVGAAYQITATLGSFSRQWRYVPMGLLQEYDEVPATLIAMNQADRLLGRDTAGAGDAEEISLGDALNFTGSQSIEVTDDGIDNVKLANMAAWTFKIRNAASTGDPSDAALANIIEETVPAVTDMLLGFLDSGEIRKFSIDNVLGIALTAVNIQAFTASGTYTPTTDMSYCIVVSTGGGGGGGGADTDGGAAAAGGAGGAGGTCIEFFSAATIGASQTVTIGAAGAAGAAASGGSGGAGGNTTFGALHTATGGALGSGTGVATAETPATGGNGGVPTNGTLNITGGAGSSGGVNYGSAVAPHARGGTGGASFWGGGGRGGSVVTGLAAGQDGQAYGSGGGGGADVSNITGVAGGAGVAGVVMAIEFIA